jgi:hypothetical protein
MCKKKMILMALTALYSLTWETAGCQNPDPLKFPMDKFTMETIMVKTSSGEKKVTYRSYMHIPNIGSPVDKDYQSMNVSVPEKV